VAYLRTRVTKGAAEALNGINKTMKRKACGFRTVEHFSAMICLVVSHLKFNLPDPIPALTQRPIDADLQIVLA